MHTVCLFYCHQNSNISPECGHDFDKTVLCNPQEMLNQVKNKTKKKHLLESYFDQLNLYLLLQQSTNSFKRTAQETRMK